MSRNPPTCTQPQLRAIALAPWPLSVSGTPHIYPVPHHSFCTVCRPFAVGASEVGWISLFEVYYDPCPIILGSFIKLQPKTRGHHGRRCRGRRRAASHLRYLPPPTSPPLARHLPRNALAELRTKGCRYSAAAQSAVARRHWTRASTIWPPRVHGEGGRGSGGSAGAFARGTAELGELEGGSSATRAQGGAAGAAAGRRCRRRMSRFSMPARRLLTTCTAQSRDT